MIYLDHNATTPPDHRVVDALLPFLRERFANAASPHARGRAAAKIVEEARSTVASLLNVHPSRIVWTSGATEAINTAIRAAVEEGGETGRDHLVVSATEHKAVLGAAKTMSDGEETTVTVVRPRSDGVVDLDTLRSSITGRTAAVIIMSSNNETGVVNPTSEVGAIAADAGARFICDVTQHLGKLPVDLSEWQVDYAAFSGHKMYGPQGIGGLVVPKDTAARPLIRGGGHERGWRSGTLNLPGVVGLGMAAQVAAENLTHEGRRLRTLRDRFERDLHSHFDDLVVHGAEAARLPNTSNVQVPGVQAEAMIANCPQVAFATGSACTSATPSPSHVLTAMGVDRTAADESCRFSLGRSTTAQDVDQALERIVAAAQRLRKLGAAV